MSVTVTDFFTKFAAFKRRLQTTYTANLVTIFAMV